MDLGVVLPDHRKKPSEVRRSGLAIRSSVTISGDPWSRLSKPLRWACVCPIN